MEAICLQSEMWLVVFTLESAVPFSMQYCFMAMFSTFALSSLKFYKIRCHHGAWQQRNTDE